MEGPIFEGRDLVEEAEAAHDSGRYAEAIALWRAVIAADPADAYAWFSLGESCRRERDYEAAEQAFRKSIELNPHQVGEAHRELAMVLWRRDELEEAEAHAREAIRLEDDDVWAWCYLTYILKQAGRLDEAEAAARKSVELCPDIPLFHCNLGDVLRRLDRESEAEAAYRQAMAVDEADYLPNLRVGMLLMDRGRLDDARVCLERAIHENPQDRRVQEGFARLEEMEAQVAVGAGREEEAFARWRAAIAAETRPQRHARFASFCIDRGRKSEGEALLQEIVREHPTYPAAHFYLGEYYADSLRDYERAAQHFRQVVELDPSDGDAHRELGYALWNNDDDEAAEKHLREAIRLDRDDAWAHDYLAVVLVVTDRDDEAEAAFRTAVNLRPDAPMFHCRLGQHLMLRGRDAEAKRSLDAGLALDVSGCMTNYYMGKYFRYYGKLTQARRYFERALRAQPDNSVVRDALEEITTRA